MACTERCSQRDVGWSARDGERTSGCAVFANPLTAPVASPGLPYFASAPCLHCGVSPFLAHMLATALFYVTSLLHASRPIVVPGPRLRVDVHGRLSPADSPPVSESSSPNLPLR